MRIVRELWRLVLAIEDILMLLEFGLGFTFVMVNSCGHHRGKREKQHSWSKGVFDCILDDPLPYAGAKCTYKAD